ncbi:MAG TPA: iron-containing alcohol dehydrogenase [Gaiellales bacterium]|nr:iron-containing alcohol dehydrogenase [Gaiellales bacterium]
MSTPEVTPFHTQLPVKLSFGDGVIAELSDVLASLEAESVFVVVEAPVEGNAGVEAAIAACANDGIRVERYLKESGEPTFAAADYVARAIVEGNFQAVVGIGGGSALDLAKAGRLLADAGGSPWDYLEGGRPFAPPALPLVLCPTTSGTGSEVSGASVLTDTDRDRKVGIANGHMRAQHALVDPLLTLGLPPGPTAHSGVDALAQAIGACTVRDGNPLSVAFGLEAAHHIGRSLERAVKDGSDRDARRQLACGSLTGGLSMNLSDCAADHALGQAIGSMLHLPHGLTIGLVLAETLDRSRVSCAPRLERVADALGEPDDGSGDGTRAVRAVRRLLKAVSFPTMAEAGVREEHVERLAELTLTEQAFFFDYDCHDWSRDEVAGAFREALALAAR